MTLTLKFSHDYLKLPPNWEDKGAKLLACMTVDRKSLPQAFIDYDTAYVGTDKIEHYPLPEGQLLVLFFMVQIEGEDGAIAWWGFPTCRSWNKDKAEYYGMHVGEYFKLVKT